MDENYAKILLNKVRKDYNQIAEEFSITRNRIWEETKPLFDLIEKGDKVLDLGCGNGRYFKVIKEKGALYFGTDISEKLLEIARNRYPEADFQKIDGLSLPYPDGFFDKVYAIAVLHHIPSFLLRLKFLKEVKRVIKDNGVLVLTIWRPRKRELCLILKYTILKIIGKSKLDFKDAFVPWKNKIKRYYHFFSERELKNLIEKSGFKVLEIGILRDKKTKRANIYAKAKK